MRLSDTVTYEPEMASAVMCNTQREEETHKRAVASSAKSPLPDWNICWKSHVGALGKIMVWSPLLPVKRGGGVCEKFKMGQPAASVPGQETSERESGPLAAPTSPTVCLTL